MSSARSFFLTEQLASVTAKANAPKSYNQPEGANEEFDLAQSNHPAEVNSLAATHSADLATLNHHAPPIQSLIEGSSLCRQQETMPAHMDQDLQHGRTP
jgi:hypothetical protein